MVAESSVEGIRRGREKEKASCRREGVVGHGWGLLIDSRGHSRVFFAVYSLKQLLILEVFFFLSAMEAQHMGSA